MKVKDKIVVFWVISALIVLVCVAVFFYYVGGMP